MREADRRPAPADTSSATAHTSDGVTGATARSPEPSTTPGVRISGWSGKGRRPLDRAVYDALVDALRMCDGDAARAAKLAGVDSRTARRAWSAGWSARGWPAVKDTIAGEQAAARAARADVAREEARREVERQVRAREDAVRARAEEAEGAKLVRANAVSLARVVGRALATAERYASELERRAPCTLSTADLHRAVRDAGALARVSAETLRLAVDTERAVLGDPAATQSAEDASPEEMVREFEMLRRFMERAGYLHSDGTASLVNGASGVKTSTAN